jgi:hypothetical protein
MSVVDFISPKSIAEFVLFELRGGPQATSDLLGAIRAKRSVTKQGFYAALRELKEKEAILLYRHTVSLNTAWIGRLQEAVNTISHAYLSSSYLPDLLALQDKESVSFTFSNSRTLDSFWGHAQSLLLQHTPESDPIYSYDPHYWFYLARKETEERLIQDIERSGRQFLMVVGGDTELDKLIHKRFAGDLLQYHRKQMFSDPSYYVTVIGDYLTEVTLDPHISARVETVYSSDQIFQQGIESALAPLLELKSRNKIKISRNRSRASMLKKKFAPFFFISRPAS